LSSWTFESLIKVVIAFALLVPLGLVVIQIQIIPAFGWDSLNFWLPSTVGIHEGGDGLVDKAGQRHPLLLQIFLSWMLSLEEAFGVSLRGIVVYFSTIVLLINCFMVVPRARLSIFFAAIYFFFSVPLLENHWMVIGYSESIVCIASVTLISAVSWVLDRRAICWSLLLAVLAGFTIVLSRNTGWAFLFIGVASSAMASAFYIKIDRRKMGYLLASLSGLLALLVIVSASPHELAGPHGFRLNQEKIVWKRNACVDDGPFDYLVVRPIYGEQQITAVDGRQNNRSLKITNRFLVESNCELGLSPALESAQQLRVEMYGDNGGLLWWGDFFPGTNVFSVGHLLEIGYGRTFWVSAFGWHMGASGKTPAQSADNLVGAMLFNSSFSLILLAVGFLTLHVAFYPLGPAFRTGAAHLTHFWVLVGVYLLAQVVLDRAYDLSVFQSDTYGSRFLLLPVAHGLMALVSFIAIAWVNDSPDIVRESPNLSLGDEANEAGTQI